MTMQRRHFELIAETIAAEMKYAIHIDRSAVLTLEQTAKRFSRVLAATNPNFNTARFLRACGVAD